ncbi:DUF4236 domain-containing protein [bacterium]|nr:DUF4236 domain-containing protein [bacterium]
MGFSFRKSVKIGPVRVNFSKSGVGVSAGVKGARIGVNAKGKAYASVGAKGFRYRTKLGGSAKRKNIAEDKDENLADVPQPTGSVVGGIGVLTIVFSFFACFVNVQVGIVGLIIGLVVLIFSSVYLNKKNESRRIRIIQDSQLTEDEIVQLLVDYCFWKKISGDDAEQTIQSMLQERENFLEQKGAEK